MKQAFIIGLVTLIIHTFAGSTASGAQQDPTDLALARCLELPDHGSTAGQTECEAEAIQSFDRRMNAAYASLMRRLPKGAANRLRESQRAWLAFRDAEAVARSEIYATRQGTMFVPMETDDATTVVADRARLLERYIRKLDIE